MPSPPALHLDFTAQPPSSDIPPRPTDVVASSSAAASSRTIPTIFGTEDELPPTWSENSPIFHTWAKCTRLQSIRRNRRITGNPGLRQHCLNCISIAATHRRG